MLITSTFFRLNLLLQSWARPISRHFILQAVEDMCLHKMADRLYSNLQKVCQQTMVQYCMELRLQLTAACAAGV